MPLTKINGKFIIKKIAGILQSQLLYYGKLRISIYKQAETRINTHVSNHFYDDT